MPGPWIENKTGGLVHPADDRGVRGERARRAPLAVVTADLTAEQFAEARHRHPERVLNLGIREQLLIGVGGGLALAGMRPVVHSFSSFLVERPFEQIKLGLNHQGVGAVLVSAGASYDIAAAGRTHQSPGDVALLGTLPDWTIHIPGHPDEAEAQLREAAQGDDLVYIRLSNQANKAPYGLGRSPSTRGLHPLREGRNATVVVVGPLADTVLDAVEDLDVSVLYATIRPFDADGLRIAIAGQREAAVILAEPYLAPHRILALGVPMRNSSGTGRPRSMRDHTAWIATGSGRASWRSWPATTALRRSDAL